MKSFTTFFTESLDKPYPYTKVSDTTNNWKNSGDLMYKINSPTGDFSVDVGYEGLDSNFKTELGIDLDRNRMARKGGVPDDSLFRVFATMIKIVDEILVKEQLSPDEITFFARHNETKGKVSGSELLAKRLVTKMARKYGYKVSISKMPAYTMFILKNKIKR